MASRTNAPAATFRGSTRSLPAALDQEIAQGQRQRRKRRHDVRRQLALRQREEKHAPAAASSMKLSSTVRAAGANGIAGEQEAHKGHKQQCAGQKAAEENGDIKPDAVFVRERSQEAADVVLPEKVRAKAGMRSDMATYHGSVTAKIDQRQTPACPLGRCGSRNRSAGAAATAAATTAPGATGPLVSTPSPQASDASQPPTPAQPVAAHRLERGEQTPASSTRSAGYPSAAAGPCSNNPVPGPGPARPRKRHVRRHCGGQGGKPASTQPCTARAGTSRAAHTLDAEQRVTGLDQPVQQRRFIEIRLALQIRHHPLAALEHLAANLGITALVRLEQGEGQTWIQQDSRQRTARSAATKDGTVRGVDACRLGRERATIKRATRPGRNAAAPLHAPSIRSSMIRTSPEESIHPAKSCQSRGGASMAVSHRRAFSESAPERQILGALTREKTRPSTRFAMRSATCPTLWPTF